MFSCPLSQLMLVCTDMESLIQCTQILGSNIVNSLLTFTSMTKLICEIVLSFKIRWIRFLELIQTCRYFVIGFRRLGLSVHSCQKTIHRMCTNVIWWGSVTLSFLVSHNIPLNFPCAKMAEVVWLFRHLMKEHIKSFNPFYTTQKKRCSYPSKAIERTA